MNSKSFNVLAVITVVLIVFSIFEASRTNAVEIEFVRGQELVTEIDPDNMTRIEITKGEDKVVLEKAPGGFRVESRDSYPADTGRINNLIQECVGITCSREISESADTHAELEVDGKAAESVTVRFLAGDKEIVGVVIGKSADDGNYVRLANSDTVYKSEKGVYLDTDALSYVDKSLTSLENVKTVEVSGNGKTYIVKKNGDNVELEGIPEGMVAKAGSHNQVFSAANSINFADFHSEASIKDVDFKHGFVATLESGERYTFRIGKQGEDFLCKVSAVYTGPQSLSVEAVKKATPEELKKHEATLQAGNKIKAFTAKHQSWVYKLESYTAENMTKAFADLIEEDKQFLKIEEKNIGEITITQPGETGPSTCTLVSPKQGELKVKDLPAGKKQRPFLLAPVFRAPTALKWTERIKPDDKILEGLEFDRSFVFMLRNKAKYSIQMAVKDNRNFAKMTAEFTGDAADTSPGAVIAKGAVAKFNERHKAHTYEVSAMDVGNMMKKIDELVMDENATPDEIGARHILIAYEGSERSTATRTKEEAKALADKLAADLKEAPGDFVKLAMENSDEPGADTSGGDLGRFKFASMTKKFSEAAFKLKVDEISSVVETEFGFHIILRTQ